MMVSLTSGGRRSAASTLTTIGHGVIDSSAEEFFLPVFVPHRAVEPAVAVVVIHPLLEDAVVVLVVVGVVDEPVAVGVVTDEIGVSVMVHVDEDLDAWSLRTDEGGFIPMAVAVGVDMWVIALRRRELLGALDRVAQPAL